MLNVVCDICGNTVTPGDEFGSVSIIMRKGFSKNDVVRSLNPKLKEKHFCSKCAVVINTHLVDLVLRLSENPEIKDNMVHKESTNITETECTTVKTATGKTVENQPKTEGTTAKANTKEYVENQPKAEGTIFKTAAKEKSESEPKAEATDKPKQNLRATNRFINKDLDEVYNNYTYVNEDFEYESRTDNLKLPGMKSDKRWVKISLALKVVNQSKLSKAHNTISKRTGASTAVVSRIIDSITKYRERFIGILTERHNDCDWQSIISLYESGMSIKDLLFESNLKQELLEYVLHKYNVVILGSSYLQDGTVEGVLEGMKNETW